MSWPRERLARAQVYAVLLLRACDNGQPAVGRHVEREATRQSHKDIAKVLHHSSVLVQFNQKRCTQITRAQNGARTS